MENYNIKIKTNCIDTTIEFLKVCRIGNILCFIDTLARNEDATFTIAFSKFNLSRIMQTAQRENYHNLVQLITNCLIEIVGAV